MDNDTNFGRLLGLLLTTMLVCLGLYGLPSSVFGYKIRKVDLLSDIRIKKENNTLDSLLFLLETDTLVMDSVVNEETLIRVTGLDSAALALRDSLYRVMYAVEGADSLGKYIEDYSAGHTGLKRFFDALARRHELGRPVRIAFMGDSFIEGDIVVADFREAMQQEFGGRGVGFVPIHSVAAQFRPTIHMKTEGWNMHTLIKEKEYPYTLSGHLFSVKEEEASIAFRTADRYPSLVDPSTLKFIYERNEGTVMRLAVNGSGDTIPVHLPPSGQVAQYIHKDTIREGWIGLTQAAGFRALGIALEDDYGVIVDNFSLRGNSGYLLGHFDPDYNRAFNELRPYDLIILQYGLNMVSEEVLQYGWYRQRMVEIIEHMKVCYPGSDLLMLGISDRGRLHDGEFETMPAVLAMLHAQRQMARLTGIPFWNMFGAMGGQNSMVRYVENNWASKGYTHLSFRGGREIARALMQALLLEKEFYDEADKTIR